MGDFVSAGVEFAVGNLLIFTNSSYAVRRSLCLFFKEVVNALIEPDVFQDTAKQVLAISAIHCTDCLPVACN